MSQVLLSIQYIRFRKISGSTMGAPNLLLAPGAIQRRYAPAQAQEPLSSLRLLSIEQDIL